MLFKKLVLGFVCTCILLSSSGCWDALDVNSKTLVVTVITDKQGDDLAFYIETPNLGLGQNQQNGNGEYNQKYYKIFAYGSTFAEARRHLDAKVDNPIYLGTVRALVITDDLAQSGIEEYMLRLQSDTQYRKALNIVTSSSAPDDILSVMPPNNISIGESIADTIASLKRLGKVVVYTLSDILNFLYSDTCFVLPNMDVKDNIFTYNGYSVIHNNRLSGFIPLDESRGLIWILGHDIKRLYTMPFEDMYASLEVRAKSKSIEPYYDNGKLIFNLNYKLESKLMYLSKDTFFDESRQKTVIDELQKKFVQEIAEAIEHSKELNCDYLQFKDIYRIKYPNKLKNINWHDAYMNAEFRITAESTMKFGSMMDFETLEKQE